MASFLAGSMANSKPFFVIDSKNVKNGKTVACYMEGEIAGFAFHLVQA